MGRIKPIGRFLTIDGEAPASESDYFMTGNYTSSTDFYIEVPARKIYDIEHLKITIEDNDPQSQNSYGADISLNSDNGILLQVVQGGETSDLTDGQLVQGFWGWERIADGGPNTFGDDYQTVLFDFKKKYGGPIVLGPGDKLKLVLKGDFTGLDSGGSHTAYASGSERNT